MWSECCWCWYTYDSAADEENNDHGDRVEVSLEEPKDAVAAHVDQNNSLCRHKDIQCNFDPTIARLVGTQVILGACHLWIYHDLKQLLLLWIYIIYNYL